MSETIKMKKITAKTWKERYKEDGPQAKNLPSGSIDFDDNKDLENCVIGSIIMIKQKVKVTGISKTEVRYDIEEMGSMKVRNQRNTKKKK